MKPTLFLSSATALTFMAASVSAGEAPMAKNPPKNPPPIQVESLCDCFDPGKIQVSLYGAGIIFDTDAPGLDDELGGGLGVGYFFTEYAGVEVDATWLATESVLHSFSGSLVLRCPIRPACLAPYILGGGGYMVNSEEQWTVHAGAGIDVRFGHGPLCPGLFADARYTWTEEEEDFVLIRAGFRFNL
jgi:Outer membrane protein beta-barrel domain